MRRPADMTVRSWFTISALVVAALIIALAFQFTRTIAPPKIVAHAAERRLEGTLEAACWPQRSGDLRCERHGEVRPPMEAIAPAGDLRFVFLYPAEPKSGSIRILDGAGKEVLHSRWKRTLRYRLAPGRYSISAQAGAATGAYVRYAFRVTVTRSGS